MPRVVDHEERRQELAVAACAVIARAGLEGTTLRGVAAEAGCTTGMVSHYFGDKEHLVLAALDAVTAAVGERILRRARHQPADLRGVLVESLPLDERRRGEWRVWTAFWAAAVGNGRLAGEHRDRYDLWRAALVEVLLRRGAEGAVEEAAEALTVAVDGIGLHATLDPQGWPVARQLAHLDRAIAAVSPGGEG